MIGWILGACLLPTTIIGAMVLYHTLIREKTKPCDKSNRINHIRLVWFAMTREEEFVHLYPWLRFDEKDNLS